MAELRNRTARQKFESWVNTANATPAISSGGPIQGMMNDLIGMIPTQTSVEDIARLLGSTAMSMPSPARPLGDPSAMMRASMAAPGVARGMAQHAVEHPFQTLANVVVPSGGGVAAAREATYATLGSKPHLMMAIRSALPWYEGKPWTRVPSGVAKAARKPGFAAPLEDVEQIHGPATRTASAQNVKNQLAEYMKSIGEDPNSVESFNQGYTIPPGLAETTGKAFVNITPDEVRILDHLKWYLSPEHMKSLTGSWSEMLKAAAMDPRGAFSALMDMLNPGGTFTGAHSSLGKAGRAARSGSSPGRFGPPSGIYGAKPYGREDLRNLVEALIMPRSVSFPIDWRIPVPPAKP